MKDFYKWQRQYWEQLCEDYENSPRYGLDTFEQFCKDTYNNREPA